MTFWLALRRWLPLLAALSFALMPAAAPAATAGMHASASPTAHRGMAMDHAGMDPATMDHAAMDAAGMDGMPCCPPEKAPDPGCGKGCPLMALCLATAASLVPAPLGMPVPVSVRVPPSWPDAPAPGTLRPPPLPEPPRA
ncbi:hypothetical protein MKK53_13615 [Methylobacterium sp. J-076]|nr:hypothetical protein [Methylobacterium sp. J-076]